MLIVPVSVPPVGGVVLAGAGVVLVLDLDDLGDVEVVAEDADKILAHIVADALGPDTDNNDVAGPGGQLEAADGVVVLQVFSNISEDEVLPYFVSPLLLGADVKAAAVLVELVLPERPDLALEEEELASHLEGARPPHVEI